MPARESPEFAAAERRGYLGRVDAGTQWRGQPDTRSRRLIGWIVLSFLLHTPLTPLAALWGLLSLLGQPPAASVPYEPLSEIPIDLIESEEPAQGSEQAQPPEPEPTAPPVPHEPEPVVEAPAPRLADAGVREKSPDSGADAGVDGARTAPDDAGADAGGPKPGEGIGDPMAVAGGTKRIADPNANVKLTIYTEQIRNQPLGPRIGPLLRSVYQWRDFFGPTAIDPIRDIDRIMVVGSQLRDSSGVIAILKHNVGAARMKQALDALALRDPGGGWIDAGVPAISTHADRAERVIAMNPPDYVVVVPPQLKEPLFRTIKAIRVGPAPGNEVLTAHVETPWRILIGVRSPVAIPESIKWARARVTPAPDGGAIAEIEAQDTSAEEAEANARRLEQEINRATQLNLGILGGLLGAPTHRFLEPATFHAEGAKIHGSLRATRQQLETLLSLGAGYLSEQGRRRNPTPSPVPAPPAVRSAEPPAPSPSAL